MSNWYIVHSDGFIRSYRWGWFARLMGKLLVNDPVAQADLAPLLRDLWVKLDLKEHPPNLDCEGCDRPAPNATYDWPYCDECLVRIITEDRRPEPLEWAHA